MTIMRLFGIVAVLLAGMAAIYLVFLRSSEPTNRIATSATSAGEAISPNTSPAVPIESAPKPSVVKGPQPALQVVKPGGRIQPTLESSSPSDRPVVPSVSLITAFADEEVEPTLAIALEKTIQSRVESVAKTLVVATEIAAVDCRTQHCRLRLRGPQSDVIALVDALQDERGFLDIAEGMMLHREGEEIQVFFRFPSADISN